MGRRVKGKQGTCHRITAAVYTSNRKSERGRREVPERPEKTGWQLGRPRGPSELVWVLVQRAAICQEKGRRVEKLLGDTDEKSARGGIENALAPGTHACTTPAWGECRLGGVKEEGKDKGGRGGRTDE